MSGIGPILPGRIPASLASTRLRENLQRGQRLLTLLQDQVATGQKFFTPSEAPAAAIRSIVLQKTIERKSQMQVNVNLDRSMLNATESALVTVSDVLNQAKVFLIAGAGDTSSAAEKNALAIETAAMIRAVVNTANSSFRGRFLFGGSESQQEPFEIFGAGLVRYSGDRHDIDSYLDMGLLQANNLDGAAAFGALTTPVGKNVDPALTLNTKVTDLLGGAGITLGSIVVTVDDTVNPIQTVTVDLSNVETIGDIETVLENAFAGGPPTLDVDIDPASNNGLRLRPAGGVGTVAVSDLAGSTVADDLGIASGAAAAINGGDLDPRLTLLTPLSAFNNGAGIGPTAGNGLLITNGPATKTIDLTTATTVEDVYNLIATANLNLELRINDAGNGLAIASRLSGANFSISENNGTNAGGLGIRTMDGTTLLKDLNFGHGVPVNEFDQSGVLLPAILEIQRRDGVTTSMIDLKGLQTVQDVLDAITAVDVNLTATLNTVGNGISIVDASGINPLTVSINNISTTLGIDGTEAGVDNTVPLVGKDVNQRQANGVLNLLVQLQNALTTNDQRALERLDPLFDAEINRFGVVRGEVGSRLRVIDQVENRLLDEELVLQESLSIEFDTDLTEVITQAAAVQVALQGTLAIVARSLQISLLNFL